MDVEKAKYLIVSVEYKSTLTLPTIPTRNALFWLLNISYQK